MQWLPDILGLVGVAMILAAYGLLQTGRWQPQEIRYSFANALGAALVLVSLAFDFNLPAAIVEGFWLLISLGGLLKARRMSRKTD